MNDKTPEVKRVKATVAFYGITKAANLEQGRWLVEQKLAARDALNKKLGRKKGGVAK